jgi:serine/threonine-protein kinase
VGYVGDALGKAQGVVMPGRSSRERGVAGWLVSALLAGILIAGAAAWIVTSRHHGRKTAKVPATVGLQQQVAKARARARGFALRVDAEASDRTPGTVLRQVPEPGAVLSKGSTMALVVSLGKPVLGVPNLLGLHSGGAERLLTTLHLKGVRKVVLAQSKPPDVVLSQNPAAGVRVAKGAQVFYTVSAGPTLVTVPSVVGMSRAEATTKLRAKGLTPIFVRVVASVGPVVVSQSPPPRSQVPRGTRVRVRIAAGGSDTGRTPTTTTGKTTTTVPRPPTQ